LSYDPVKDLAPVTNVVTAQQLLLVNKSVPAKAFTELAAYSRANPNKLNYGSFGVGGDSHLVIEWMKAKSDAKMTHVPFGGAAPALVAFDGGDIQVLYLVATPPIVEKVKSGQANGMLVSGKKRNPNLPQVPSFLEAGLPVQEFETWFGMFAPAATPTAIVKHMSSVVWAAVSSKDFIDNVLLKIGFELNSAITPERFAAFLREDRQRWKESVAQIDPKKLVQ
jgi:tripartite-type tricarboxylate transporter receptor subunit TctC